MFYKPALITTLLLATCYISSTWADETTTKSRASAPDKGSVISDTKHNAAVTISAELKPAPLAEVSPRIGQEPVVRLKPAPGALPELPQLQKKPDLIPVLTQPMTAKVAVKNLGPGHAAASVLTIECKNRDPRKSCAESRLMQRYLNPVYPNKIVIQIPALAPGQVWVHVLGFWDSLNWKPGAYAFTAIADEANQVAEHNEGNNVTQANLMVP